MNQDLADTLQKVVNQTTLDTHVGPVNQKAADNQLFRVNHDELYTHLTHVNQRRRDAQDPKNESYVW